MYLAATPEGQLVALKVMLEHLTVRQESREAFLREGRTASLLKHPNLVEVYDAGEADGRPWISMELVRGWSLSALQKKLKASGVRLDADEAAEVIRQAALGLHFAHEVKGREGEPLGLVHRDVSPQNIMVSETGHAKVVDFGLAKATAISETVTTTIKGKLRYMPPEQLKSQKLDRRADVFALGAVLWELATGTALYPGASEAEVVQQALYSPQPHPDEVAKGLSRNMVAVLLATTQRETDKRMGSAKELAEALAPLSSPHARDKLGERIAKHFDRIPKTLDEARGAPTQSMTVPVSLQVELHKQKRVGVLGPPPPKQPSYVDRAQGGPVPEDSREFRERRTDQMEAPPKPTNPSLPPPVPTPAPGHDAPMGSDGPTGPNNPVSQPSLTVPPLIEPETTLTTTPGQPRLFELAEQSDTNAGLIPPPSRRTIILAACASVGLVALGALVGALLRNSGDEGPDPNVDPRLSEAPVPSVEDLTDMPVYDGGGPTAARVAGAKKPSRLGRVEIDSNVPAVVRERNADLGVTPFSRMFNPGRHRLSVATPDGTASAEMDVVVKPGETLRKTVRLNVR